MHLYPHLLRGPHHLLLSAIPTDTQPGVVIRKALFTWNPRRELRPSGLDMACPAASVAEVGHGEHRAADGAGPMAGLHMAVALNGVGEVQVAEVTVQLAVAINVVVAQAVGVAERDDDVHAVPAAEVPG